MFTGLVADKGEVTRLTQGNNSRRLYIRTKLALEKIAIGASVACDGCCLTVVEKGTDWLAFDVGAETMMVTAIGDWVVGTQVNLEPSLRLGDELGGHIVSGHVDGLATVEAIQADGKSGRLKIRVPQKLAHYIAPKGSVALNGISLTVNEVDGAVFGICVIPHTWAVTNISQWRVGGQVHVEIDTLARYVARMLGREAA